MITLMAIRVTLPRSWGIHNVFHVNLLEPYRTSIQARSCRPAQVLRDYDNFIAEDCTIEEIIGSSYDKQEKRVMYLVQWLDYPDCEDWTEELFEHMMTALEMLSEFHKSNPDTSTRPLPQGLRGYIPIFLGLSMLRFFNSILDPGDISFCY
jgi:hypothetical protein